MICKALNTLYVPVAKGTSVILIIPKVYSLRREKNKYVLNVLSDAIIKLADQSSLESLKDQYAVEQDDNIKARLEIIVQRIENRLMKQEHEKTAMIYLRRRSEMF